VRLKLLAEAEEEIEAAASWYEDRGTGLGDELLLDVPRAFDLVLRLPLAWPLWPDAPKRSPPIRRILLKRFSYGVAYQVFSEQIVVLAVAHTSRRPFYWMRRVR
jgi:toxin ParE1/3/4